MSDPKIVHKATGTNAENGGKKAGSAPPSAKPQAQATPALVEADDDLADILAITEEKHGFEMLHHVLPRDPPLSRKRMKAVIRIWTEKIVARRNRLEEEGADLWWYPPTARLLVRADKAVDARNVNAAWRYFQAASRLIILSYSEAELHVHEMGLHAEVANNTNSWRQQTATKTLETPPEAITGPEDPIDKRRQRLMRAQYYRDTDHQIFHHKLAMFKSQRSFLLGGLIATVLALPVMYGFYADPTPSIVPAIPFWGIVFLFGLLGGILSGIFQTTRLKPGAEIREQAYENSLALTRAMVGGAAGVAAAVLVNFGLVPFMELSSQMALAPVAFIGGFSESFLVGAVKKSTK